MQQRYNGRYCWSLQARGHASWCYLQVIQAGEHSAWLANPDLGAVVILTSMQDNPGTSISGGIENLAPQILDMFRLNPEHTTFLEHTPPVPLFPDYGPVPDEDPASDLERMTSSLFGSSEGKYERIVLTGWQRRGGQSGPLYQVQEAAWVPITSREVFDLIQQLDHCSV